MSRSRKKVAHHYNCVVNHRQESKHYAQRRRQYRSILNHHVRINWTDEDMLLPSRFSYYDKWDAPSDGNKIEFNSPEFTNPFDYICGHYYSGTNLYSMTRIKKPTKTIEELYLIALQKDFKNLQWYKKSFRK